MENRARLRVQKRKGFKRGQKHLLKSVVDYLKSDSFMYAPILSSMPADFRSPDTLLSSARVVELKKPIMENKLFLEQVGDYMKSDVYMYAPITAPPHPPQECLLYYRRIRMSVPTTRLTMKVNQPSDHLGNANQRSENHLPQSGPSDQHTQGNNESVRQHTVYQTCHSNSASGKVTLNSQLTARVI